MSEGRPAVWFGGGGGFGGLGLGWTVGTWSWSCHHPLMTDEVTSDEKEKQPSRATRAEDGQRIMVSVHQKDTLIVSCFVLQH